jgi:hypothetical protein
MRFQALLVTVATALAGALAIPGAAAADIAPAPSYNHSSFNSSTPLTPGTTLVSGSNCDDCVTTTPLPFDFDYMGVTYPAGTTLYLSTNGAISFDTSFPSNDYTSVCPLPDARHGAALFPLWQDLDSGTAASPTEGIFTTVTGSAPNRRFVIEWRTQRHAVGSPGDVHFEVQLAESNAEVYYYYGSVDGSGALAAVGIQQGSAAGSEAIAYECHTGGMTGNQVVYFYPSRPFVDGLPEQGLTLQASAEGFTGSPAPTLTYQWQRCDAAGDASSCVDIPGAMANQYVMVAADLGHTLRVAETGTNPAGSAHAISATTDVVKPQPPPAPLYFMSHQSGATYLAGTTNVGASGDDVQTAITFPFPVEFYGQSYTTGFVGSNGSLGLGLQSDVTSNTNGCLPATELVGDVIAAYQMDLRTDQSGAGVFSSVMGTAPHRTFILDWHAAYYADTTKTARFEIVLREDSPAVSVIYGASADNGDFAVAGIQHDPAGPDSQFSCGSGAGTGLATPGTMVTYAPSQPRLSKIAKQGTAVTFSAAVFSGSPTLKAQWERCSSQGQGCVGISGATGPSYTPGIKDVGHTLRVRQIATNQWGSASSLSQPSGVVAALPTPKLTNLRVSPASFRAAHSGGSTASATGTAVSFTLSESATVRFTVATVKNGTRKTLPGSFVVTASAGHNSLHFTGRLNGHTLGAGRYVLSARPTAAGHRGSLVSVPFRIVS